MSTKEYNEAVEENFVVFKDELIVPENTMPRGIMDAVHSNGADEFVEGICLGIIGMLAGDVD